MDRFSRVVLSHGSNPILQFAAGELTRALATAGWQVETAQDAAIGLDIRLHIDAGIAPEGFCMDTPRRVDGAWHVLIRGGDGNGVLYGALALAEELAAGYDPGHIVPRMIQPPQDIRAVKINLPWESYRKHDSLQLHADACRDLGFWRDLIDDLARARWNRLTLWSLHPWALMVRPTKYPEACDLSDKELAEWQAFWHGIFSYAHGRGMKIQMFTWNIMVSPAFARARGVATYSIDGSWLGDGDLSPLVEDYTREIITEVLRAFPDLDGLGLATAERMGGLDNLQRGEWVRRTFGAAVLAAGRPVEINFRVPHSGSSHCNAGLDAASMSDGRRMLEGSDFPGEILSEVKFNWSHGHSTPHLRQIHNGPPGDALWNPPPTRYRLTWMVRNEDFTALRWCAPSFIRAHLRLNSHPWVAGYYIGSETFIPAVNYIDRPDHAPRARWLFQRQRLFYAVWGRLLADPTATDAQLGAMIDHAYDLPLAQRGVGQRLLPVLDHAGTIPLRIATFLNFTWDHTLYCEGLLTLDGFIDLQRVRQSRPLEPDWLSIPAAVQAEIAGTDLTGKLHPAMLADELDAHADAVEALLAEADFPDLTGPMMDEQEDARTWAAIGRYIADKIRAALFLERSERSPGQDVSQRTLARAALDRCVGHWQEVVARTTARYQAFPVQHLEKTGRNRWHWQDWLPAVQAETEAIC